MKRRIAIVGGGLAGIAAAVRLAEDGCTPILFETRKRLGGRATSLLDPRSGRIIDNCQHVLMGCCTNLVDLYARLDVLEEIEWHRRFYWTRGDGRIEVLKPSWTPAPFHLGPSLMRMKMFTRADKRAIARAMWRLIRLGSTGRLAWRGRPFSDFLSECSQPPPAVERFWSTVIVSACNLDVDQVDAALAMQVFQEGFLANRWACPMGLSVVPLSALYDPAVDLLMERDAEIHMGASVRAIAFDGRRVTGVVTGEGFVEAAAVVAAVPFDRLHKLVSATMRRADVRLQRLDAIEVSPILGVHLLFDHQIMDLPHLTVVGLGVQWLFNKGVDAEGRQHLHAVISAADAWMELSEEEIADRVVADVHQLLPRAVGLRPLDVRAIKERRATFAARPGIDALRPRATPGPLGLGGGGIPNLYLAGDWCDTGWPATMEGAVRSGYAAAAAITGCGGPVEDAPPSALAWLLGLR